MGEYSSFPPPTTIHEVRDLGLLPRAPRLPQQPRWRCGTCGSSEHLHAAAGAIANGPLDPVTGELARHDDVTDLGLVMASIACAAPGCTCPDVIHEWIDGRWAAWETCPECQGAGEATTVWGGPGRCGPCGGEGGQWADAPESG